MKKLKIVLVSLALALLSLFAFVGCRAESLFDIAVRNGFTGSEQEFLQWMRGRSAFELAQENGFTGTLEEWLASFGGGAFTLDELLSFFLNEVENSTVEDFLAIFVPPSDIDPTMVAAQTALRSAVSVRARFGSSHSGGAGVILRINPNGVVYIVTNYHVIFDNDSRPRTSDNIFIAPFGREFFGNNSSLNPSLDLSTRARFVGGSRSLDIAVLRTDPDINSPFLSAVYKPAVIGNSNNIVVGESIFAVGNPLGHGLSVTTGAINVESEFIQMSRLDSNTGTDTHRVFRLDAAINGGNSGGGVFNRRGELVGIVNAKMVAEEIENIGYAIPVNVAYGLASIVMRGQTAGSGGEFARFNLGIFTEISGSKAVLGSDGTIRIVEDVRVTDVQSGSPARNIVQVDDVLVSAQIDDRERINIDRNFTLRDEMLHATSNSTVQLRVRRGALLELDLTIALSAGNFTAI